MPEVIMSNQNRHLKQVRKLARRKTREQEQAFVVEGEDLVLAGLETGARPQVLLVDAERVPELDPALVTCPVLHVEPKLLAEVSGMGHPPRVIGIFELPAPRDLAVSLDERSVSGATGPWIALDGIADPGNVGTVLRSAAAFAAGGVIALPGTADPWGLKAVRASMGACFRTPVVRLDAAGMLLDEELDAVRARMASLRIVALDADADVELRDVPLDPSTVIVIGGERDGLSPQMRAVADVVARIPQQSEVDSVNAGVAASIALYEWARAQRKESR
ncbi:MAG: RNA methyltransferase [Gaiellales bacterium]